MDRSPRSPLSRNLSWSARPRRKSSVRSSLSSALLPPNALILLPRMIGRASGRLTPGKFCFEKRPVIEGRLTSGLLEPRLFWITSESPTRSQSPNFANIDSRCLLYGKSIL